MTHYIYALIDPRDGTIRYCGRTIAPAQRLSAHINCIGGSPVHRWIADVRTSGNIPVMQILDSFSSTDARHETVTQLENLWIKHLESLGYELTNYWPAKRRERKASA